MDGNETDCTTEFSSGVGSESTAVTRARGLALVPPICLGNDKMSNLRYELGHDVGKEHRR